MLFDSRGIIRKYDTPEDVLREFYNMRLQFYVKRKAMLLQVGRHNRRLVGSSPRCCDAAQLRAARHAHAPLALPSLPPPAGRRG